MDIRMLLDHYDGTVITLTPIDPETPVGEIEFEVVVKTADGTIVAVKVEDVEENEDEQEEALLDERP